jgi:hypothetical protein
MPGGLPGHYVAESRHGRPVCYKDWFGATGRMQSLK